MDAPLDLTDLPAPFSARAATWADVDAVTAVVAACEQHHDGVVGVDREDVVADWQRGTFDLPTESVVVLDGDRIVAEVDVFKGRAEANVHPDRHGRGVGTWLLGQAERIARAQDVPRASQTISDRAPDAASLLQRHGYAFAYTSWILRIDHTERPPDPELPAGIVFRDYVPGADDHEVFQVIEDAFAEWPDRLPHTFEDWYPIILGRASFEPWMMLLAADETTAEIVGVANVIDQDPDAGWVQQLATKATHRHRGIGRALMRRAMTVFWDRGKPALEVSTDSRTGALGLYEKVGMSVTVSYTNYAKDLWSLPILGSQSEPASVLHELGSRDPDTGDLRTLDSPTRGDIGHPAVVVAERSSSSGEGATMPCGTPQENRTQEGRNSMTQVHRALAACRRHGRAALVVITMLGSLVALPGTANAAVLTNLSWTVSNNQISATNVTYSYSFRTASVGTIKTITFTVSGAGLGGAPAIVKNYGISAGTVARAGQTITYTVTTAASIPANIPIYIEFSGLTNSGTAGSYTTDITTKTAAAATIDGPTTTPAVTLAANNTAVTVTLAKSLTFTLDTTAFELDMDPSLPALADQSQAIGITVLTNANSGYTLTVSDNAAGLVSAASGAPTIPDVSANKGASVTWPSTPAYGYRVTATGATADAAFSGSKYAGYTSAGEVVATHGSSTGATADTITITNRVAVDYSIPATTFTDTITYTVTPNYT